jgi:hypothetical protein
MYPLLYRAFGWPCGQADLNSGASKAIRCRSSFGPRKRQLEEAAGLLGAMDARNMGERQTAAILAEWSGDR